MNKYEFLTPRLVEWTARPAAEATRIVYWTRARVSNGLGFFDGSSLVIIASIDDFLSYVNSVRGRTRRVVQTIPPDRIEWTHREGAFTLGDLVRHLGSTERYMFAETARGNVSAYPGHGRDLADGYDAVLAYLDRTHAEALDIYQSLSPEALAGRCTTPAGTSITTWKWLRAMVEHEIHHRGQIYLMLGMLDVRTPPLYGLTEEQLRERSVPA